MEISILGSGSWSTAIAVVLAEKHDVLMYTRSLADAHSINEDHINSKYFPDINLPKNIRATTDISELFSNKYIVNGIPTQAIRSVLITITDYVKKDHIFINLSKGLELDTHYRISEIFREVLGDVIFAVLSGPTHAEELIHKMPTAIVCASDDENLAKEIQLMFATDYFRVYRSTDVVGVELGGAIKNILALSIGMLTGLGYGDNSKAALITRGVHEMNKFAINFGADPVTINGLAGIGDLIVTATSLHSRNNRAGILLGQGMSLDEVVKEINMVVEGIPTTKAVYEKAKEKNIELPITNEIYKVLFEDKSPDESVDELMGRNLKSEF